MIGMHDNMLGLHIAVTTRRSSPNSMCALDKLNQASDMSLHDR